MSNCKHHIVPTKKYQCLLRWKSLVDRLKKELNQKPCDGYYESRGDDDDKYMIDSSDKDGTVSTSLGLHLEVVLDIDH